MKDRQVAVIGTGRMGFPLARRLLDQGVAVTVSNRSPEKARPLRGFGARITEWPRDAVMAAEAVIMMLADGPTVDSVLGQPGVMDALRGRTLIQMTTVGSDDSRRVGEQVGLAGGDYLEAPVMGGPADAEKGQMVIMVGADQPVFERWRPLLGRLGREVVWVGQVGKAAVLKVCLNQFMGMLAATLSQAVNILQAEEIPTDLLMGILKQFPYYAPAFDSKLPRMLAHDYSNPSFTCRLMMKDTGLAAAQASRLGVDGRLLDALTELFRAAGDQGLAELDYSAVHEALRPPSRV